MQKNFALLEEFIEGDEINEENIEIVAKGLREIHEVGYVLGDTKISNFVIVNRSKLAVIDAEQSFKSNNLYYRAWDLVVFFLFLSYKIVNINHFQEVAKRFLDEYMPDKSIAKEFFDIKNINLMGLYPPNSFIYTKKLNE